MLMNGIFGSARISQLLNFSIVDTMNGDLGKKNFDP
jgi:hypothetical protein